MSNAFDIYSKYGRVLAVRHSFAKTNKVLKYCTRPLERSSERDGFTGDI